MSKFSKIFFRIFAGVCVCFILTIAVFATGLVDPPIFLDIYQDKQYDELASSEETESSSNYSGNYSDGSVTISTSNGNVDVGSVPSALNINLSGNYLTAFQKATKTLSKSDTKSMILIKVGLQILQSKTIKYENALHFYSLSYKNTGGTANAQSYSLKNCISRINNGKTIYTDCFGFVRLAHSIACYTINSTTPESVSGLSGLYGWKGGYSEGKSFNSMKKLKSGAVIYDTQTGLDVGYSTKNRHVAMYLYTNGTEVVLMDQGGIRTGKFKSGSYIYATYNSKGAYKFDKFKNYN